MQKKFFDKIQYPFMIKKQKTLQKKGREGIYLNIIKAIDNKFRVNTLSGEKLKAFPLKSGTRQGCPLSPPLLDTVLEVLATPIGRGKAIKWIQIRKGRTVTADEMTLHIENSKWQKTTRANQWIW